MSPPNERSSVSLPASQPAESSRIAPAGWHATWVSGLALVMVLGTLSCKQEKAAVAPPSPLVEVLEVVSTNLPLSHEVIGRLDSPENVEIRARVEAFVDKVLFTEGSIVKEGDPLFALDRKPFQQRLAAARGQLAQAKASLGKYEKDVERLKPLAEKKAIPRQDLENAVASVEVGRAAVLSAEAAEQSAMIDLGYCDLRSPITGRIGAKQVTVGDLVGKGQPTLLATISKTDPIWFHCGVSEVALLRAEAVLREKGKTLDDMPVTLILADGRQVPDKGRFVFVDRAVDSKTGTLRLRAEFANKGGTLRPGMFARIQIDLGTRPDSVVVPERALVELQGKDFVWVIGDGDQASQREVKRLSQGPGASGVLIENGLKVGERIVVAGAQKVREGGVVQPRTAAQMAELAKAEAASGPDKKAAGSKPAHGGKEKE